MGPKKIGGPKFFFAPKKFSGPKIYLGWTIHPQILLDVPFHITAPRGTCFVVITWFNDNGNMILVVELVVVFVVNFAMNKMRFRVMKE